MTRGQTDQLQVATRSFSTATPPLLLLLRTRGRDLELPLAQCRIAETTIWRTGNIMVKKVKQATETVG